MSVYFLNDILFFKLDTTDYQISQIQVDLLLSIKHEISLFVEYNTLGVWNYHRSCRCGVDA